MTLRELFDMAEGKRRELRQHALDIAWTVGQLFNDKPASHEIESFLKTGHPYGPNIPEPHNPLVDAKVAEYYRTGKIIVE